MSKTKWLIGGAAVIVIAGAAYASFGQHSKHRQTVTIGIMSGSKRTKPFGILLRKLPKINMALQLNSKIYSYSQQNKAGCRRH